MNTAIARVLESDLLYSFRRSPAALVSAIAGLVLVLGAVLAPWIAPHDPTDLASLSLLDSFKPPIPL
ncbi:MAG: ABC transporter permease, partial [Acetobacteraceae bacterium]|nr:ABC transporter permease [Acetobacteraceae bacterium]